MDFSSVSEVKETGVAMNGTWVMGRDREVSRQTPRKFFLLTRGIAGSLMT